MFLWGYDVNVSANKALGESADFEEVLGVYLEDDEVTPSGWNCGLWVSTGELVNTDSSIVLSTDTGTYAVATDK